MLGTQMPLFFTSRIAHHSYNVSKSLNLRLDPAGSEKTIATFQRDIEKIRRGSVRHG